MFSISTIYRQALVFHLKLQKELILNSFAKFSPNLHFALYIFRESAKAQDSLNLIFSSVPMLGKTFWKIESPNAISGIHLGGMAKKIFFLVTKLFCSSRQNAETFRFSLKFKFVKPHKLSTHLAFSDDCYFHLFLSVV